MIEAAARWGVRGVSLLLLGPLAARGAGMVRGSDGSGVATALTGDSLGVGLAALGVVAGCVWAASALAARLADRHEALLNMGFVLAWVAWTGGALGEIYRLSPTSGTLVRLAAETLLMAGVVLAGWLVADRLSRRSVKQEGLGLGVDAVRASVAGAGGAAAVAAVAAGVGAAWLFARHDLPGQSLGAAFLAGVLGGVAAAVVSDAMRKDKAGPFEPVVAPAMLGVLAAGLVAPLIGLFAPGAGGLLEGIARGSLPGWVLVAPAGWAAGALLGVPVGVSFVHNRATQAASKGGRAGVPKDAAA